MKINYQIKGLPILLLIAGWQGGEISAAMPEINYPFEIEDDSFKSLKFSNPDNFFASPVIRLNSQDRMVLSFDQLAYDKEDLAASITHCNSDWEPSALQETEYLNSFNFEELEDFGFSSNTFQHFVNYQLEIPSENLSPLKSGNYLITVFRREDPDDIILRARFRVVEPLVNISGEVTSRTDRGADNHWQQLSIKVDPNQLQVRDPYNDLIIKVTQNEDPFSVRSLRTPLRIDGKSIIYAHQPDLIFGASNEFRRFETVRASYPGLGIDSVRFDDNRYHAYVSLDTDRSEREYNYDSTQRGRFLIREFNSTDSDLGADYIDVHFTLDFPEIMNGDIFVQGEMTGYKLEPSNRMVYDRESGVYRLSMPLKQGSYNYRYAASMRDSAGNPTWAEPHPETIEGNHYETINEYRIDVYYRPHGARADRLVGSTVILSNDNPRY